MSRMRQALNLSVSQQEFAELVNLSPARVSQLVAEGALPRDSTCLAMLDAYIERLQTQAAGRDIDGNLTRERARLAKESADKIARENAVARGEYAPLAVLEAALSHVTRQLATQLDSIVPTLRRRQPDLPAAALRQVGDVLVQCRELCARASLGDANADEDLEDDEQARPAPAP